MAKIDSLFPILNNKPLTGLARTAAEAPLDSTGCLTEYRPLVSRSIVSKVNSKRGAPFTHAINPYRGCEFGCRYCYARYTHEFLEMRDPEEFERKIYFKQNAAWLLTQTSGFILGIVSKSALVARDTDLLTAIAKRNRLTVHLTVTTMNTKLARILEPRAPRPDLRMATVAHLRQAGLRAGVLCSPLMPGITDTRSSIAAVAQSAAAADASFFASGPLFLKPCSLPTFFAFVKKHFPEQLPAYEKRYEKSAFVSPEYSKRVAALIDSVCREYKLGRRYSGKPEDDPRLPKAPVMEAQPWLPFETTGT